MFVAESLKRRYVSVLEQIPSEKGDVFSFYYAYAVKNYLPYVGKVSEWRSHLPSGAEERLNWIDVENLTLAYSLLDITMYIHTRIQEGDLFENKVLAALMGDYCYTSFLVQIASLPIVMQKKVHGEFSRRIEGYLQSYLGRKFPQYETEEGVRSFDEILKTTMGV